MRQKWKSEDDQRGAIIVDACISLPIYMFVMFALLYIAQISYTQARIALAVDCATKELAQYGHVVYEANIPQTFNGSGGESSEIINKVAEFLTKIGDGLSEVDTELGDTVTTVGDKMEGDSVSAYILHMIGEGMVDILVEKNMIDWEGDTAKDFRARHRVVDYSLAESKVMEDGSKDIFIKVTYKIRMVQLLGLKYDFQLAHCAYAQVWAGG